MHSSHAFAGFEVVSDTLHGEPGGYLRIRRLVLRNRDADGSVSEPYTCDFAVRPMGLDAVVVVLWHRAADGRAHVLLRRGLRPALAFGRAAASVPVPDARPGPHTTEIVAGILEAQDHGEQGIRERAAAEALEEAGFTIDPADVQLLGAGTFPTPGSMPEKYWLTTVEVDPASQRASLGDGSPLEHYADTWWCELDRAIADCVAGEILDAKTELALRRLKDRLTAR